MHLDPEIQAALDALPPDFRVAVVLCDLEQLSYEEIAATLGIKVGTVRSRIHRGRVLLRAGAGPPGPPPSGRSLPPGGAPGMKPQHLSDEAVAAFADGVLTGSARERAARHLGECRECAEAVRVQREATSVLRTAPAPALPTSLVDRLRTVPMTAPLPPPTGTIGPDGNLVISTLGSIAGPMAALAPASASARSRNRGRTYLTAAVLAGVTGAIAGVVAGSSSSDSPSPQVQPVNHVSSANEQVNTPVYVFHGRPDR